MYFSCKITHGILSYLESEKVDLSAYFSEADVPWELLRDSSRWMRAPDMEAFLDRLSLKEEQLVKAGHRTPKSRCWGVLDSVLRMMPKPEEIFQQPEKFLSYFISPEPPIENLERFATGLSFDIPLPAEQYPLISTYLRAAFESLPVYVGKSPAHCEWTDIHFKIEWSDQQQSIMNEETEDRTISPQLMREVIRHSRELEEKNRELQRRNEELSNLVAKGSGPEAPQPEVNAEDFSQFEFMKQPVHHVAQNLSRLHDYMVRAHQLVVLLTAGQKQTAGMREAFHRVDWEIVKDQYPKIIFDSIETLKKLNKPENQSKETSQ